MGNHQLALEDFKEAVRVDDMRSDGMGMFSEGYFRMGQSKMSLAKSKEEK